MQTARRILMTLTTLTAAALVVTACGSPATSSKSATSTGKGAKSASTVLPVKHNPITNTSTAPGLQISSMLVENNVDPATGKAAADHLELELYNTSSKPLTNVEVYYTFDDSKLHLSESYYTKLAPNFTIAPGAKRKVHFDDVTATDHYPDNQYSIYRSSKDALQVTAEVSAADVAPATKTIKKDAGGAEDPSG